jgi:hypothetical protein
LEPGTGTSLAQSPRDCEDPEQNSSMEFDNVRTSLSTW